HSITLQVSDSHGATAQATVVVNVVDTTAPSVICPASTLTVVADADCGAALPDFTVNAIVLDNCSAGPALVKSQNPAAGTRVSVGVYSVAVSVTDPSGHSGSCTVLVTVVDTTSPSVACPQAATLAADANCQAALLDFRGSVVASDGCTPAAEL